MEDHGQPGRRNKSALRWSLSKYMCAPPTILGLILVATRTLGSPPIDSSCLWSLTACESNRLIVTETSLITLKSDQNVILFKVENQIRPLSCKRFTFTVASIIVDWESISNISSSPPCWTFLASQKRSNRT